MAAARAVLTNDALMTLVLGYQHGLLYTFVPHYKRWRQVHVRWQELIQIHRRRTTAQEAMTFQCTCLYTPSELCLATLSGPAVCLEYEKAYHAHVAIRNSDLDALNGWLNYCPTLATAQAITCAARYGALECLERLIKLCETTPVQALEYAVERGHFHIVRKLYQCYQVNQLINEGEFNLLDVAAATGHLAIVEFLHNAGYPRRCTTKAMDTASANGHLTVVEFLHNYRHEGATSGAIDGAAANGHLDVVIYLNTTRNDGATKSAMDVAAARGFLNIVKYLNENRSEGCGSYALDDASKAGHLDIVKYLHFNVHSKPLCTFRAMNNAALNGYLEIIKFLHDNRTEGCTTFAMDWTASKGKLRELEEKLEKKELQRQDERQGRTSAEKELRGVLQAKLNLSAGYYVQPIATLDSVFPQCLGTPRQGFLAPGTKGRVRCHNNVSPEALDGLEAFSHVWITFVFHCNTNGKNVRAHEGLMNESKSTAHTFRAKVSPPMLKQRMGVFATRTPHRPNPIGITLVKIDQVDKKHRCVYVSGIDLVDGTPILDLKPYVPAYDCIHSDQVQVATWIEKTVGIERSVEWSQESLDGLQACSKKSKFYKDDMAGLCTAIEQVLAVDVRSIEQTKKMLNRVNVLHFDKAIVEYKVYEEHPQVCINRILITDVLTNQELMREICGYQCGVYEDVRACVGSVHPSSCYLLYPSAFRHLWLLDMHPLYSALDQQLAVFARHFKEWIACRRYEELWRLVSCAEHMSFVLLTHAIVRSDLELLTYVLTSPQLILPDRAPFTHTIDMAAWKGHVKVVQYLLAHPEHKCTNRAIDIAAKSGHLPVVEFLHVHGMAATWRAMNYAAGNGYMRVVQFLHERRNEGCSTDAMDEAAANGHLEVVAFLHYNRREGCTQRAMDQAATNGHLDVVKFLHFNRNEGCTTQAIDGASANGHIAIVLFLTQHRHEGWSVEAYLGAESNRHDAIITVLNSACMSV
ncbi:hypothetical protein THRCLA_02043 [Thraustotheca clavata]|uniref:TsaA-like domain-containing protein n=1 Tax=Thraustotheca clavata TaxID=74557 RepID=A0A1W0A6M6_9STRA|nr:hypothetical protein THRCLA_02043 [Thraustotheca clavata]